MNKCKLAYTDWDARLFETFLLYIITQNYKQKRKF